MANIDKGKGGQKRKTAAAMTSKADTVCDASTTQGPADTDADIEEMRRVIFNSEHVEKAGGSDKDSGIILTVISNQPGHLIFYLSQRLIYSGYICPFFFYR